MNGRKLLKIFFFFFYLLIIAALLKYFKHKSQAEPELTDPHTRSILIRKWD